MTHIWVLTEYGFELTGLPPWCERGLNISNWSITLEPRPNYCDRGRWLAKCHAPLDHQEGWPRYYFSLAAAKSEIAAWVAGRQELKEPA